MKRVTIDERRQVLVAKTAEEAYEFCVHMFIENAKKAIDARASFSVALAGGQTPQSFYEMLAEPSSALMINWPRLDLFWSDERCVLPDSSESNYGNAMHYFSTPPLDQAKKYRLIGENKESTKEYEKTLKTVCSEGRLDLMLLGIGDDGHTASLFPNTEALKEHKSLVVPNYVPQKECWRLTMTFPAIDLARNVYVLALGRGKSKILKKIFFGEYNYIETPAQRIGTKDNPAVFIIDKKAAYGLGLKT